MKGIFTSGWALIAFAILIAGCDAEDRERETNPAPAENAPAEGEGSVQVGGIVEWLNPAVAKLLPRSDAEKSHGMEHGRGLPEPEFLQPPLDPALTSFSARLDSKIEGLFLGGASDILPGLVHAWIAEFNRIYPKVHIETGTPYAGSLGMLQVIEGNYDFVFVSRELKPTDITTYRAKYGSEPLSVPVSGASYRHYGFLDAIGFFVHIENPLTELSLAQIDAIFSSTSHRGREKIRTWGELGLAGSWKDQPIHAYGVKPWNGFEEFVRQRALDFDGKRGEWRDDMDFSRNAFPVAEKVAKDPLGIGYTGIAYIDHGLKVLPLVDESGSGEVIAPSYKNVAKASYPLSRLIYFNTHGSAEKAMHPLLSELVRFILSREGQRIVLDQAIYLPLRSHQAQSALARLN